MVSSTEPAGAHVTETMEVRMSGAIFADIVDSADNGVAITERHLMAAYEFLKMIKIGSAVALSERCQRLADNEQPRILIFLDSILLSPEIGSDYFGEADRSGLP